MNHPYVVQAHTLVSYPYANHFTPFVIVSIARGLTEFVEN